MAVLRRIINRIRSQREEGEVQATYYHTGYERSTLRPGRSRGTEQHNSRPGRSK